MRPLHPREYVLLVSPNEANRARRCADRFNDKFGAVGYGGLGRGQTAHDSAVDVGAGSEIAKPFIDSEKFLRDLEHRGVNGAGFQSDVSHVARSHRKKSNLIRRHLVGDQNLASKDFGQGAVRRNAKLFAP